MTEQAAKNLLIAVAEGERDLEASRAALCRSYNFVPSEAFSRINRDNSNGIDIVEIINFLKDNNVTDIDDAEVAHVVDYYDTLEKQRNQVLTIDEWNSIVLLCEDNTLREQVLARQGKEWKDIGRLPANVEDQIADILIKEVQLIRKVEALKNVLLSVEGVNVDELFKAIDGNKNGEFTMDELSEFLKKNGYDATPDEIVAIIRRLDTDGSQTITLLEFSKYMTLLNPAPQAVDVQYYNPTTPKFVEAPLYRSYYSPYWDAPYYSSYYRYPSYSRYYSPYWRSPYYYGGYSSYSSYLDTKYGLYSRPSRYYYDPVYDYVPPARTVYSSPIREKVVYTSSYSPVSTAYSYSSPVRTVYSSPYVDRTYVSPYSGSVIYY